MARDRFTRKVTRVEVREGPRGGTLVVRHFECGHAAWMRAKEPRRPPREGFCTTCWLEQSEKEAARR